jgi:hypothetical protein
MTIRLSTGLANNIVGSTGVAASFAGGVIDIYTGTQPVNADSATTGTLLGRVSIASATYAAETSASAIITVIGAAGSINTVNVGSMNIIPLGAVTFVTDVATTAQALCDAINRNGLYRATYPGTGAIVTVIAPPGTGAAHNGLALALTQTTMTSTCSATISTVTVGVAATAGIQFGVPSGGTVSKSGIWSFNGVAVGNAGWFRMKASAVDSDLASTTLVRLDGYIAVSGANMNLSNLSIAIGAPTTIDTMTISMPLTGA